MINKNKRAQVTIFIIIAILIVAMVALFFMLRGGMNKEGPSVSETINPESFLKTCMEEAVEETIEILSYQGGYMENDLNVRYQFEGEAPQDISYLCYTSAYNSYCVVQQPSIINHMERGFEKDEGELADELDYCFDTLVKSYQDIGYAVDSDYNNFTADLIEDKLILNINAKLTLTKTEQTQRYDGFEMKFPTKLYNLGKIVNDIIEAEANVGGFDETVYAFTEYKVAQEPTVPSPDKIYTIEHRKTKEKFRIAIRGK